MVLLKTAQSISNILKDLEVESEGMEKHHDNKVEYLHYFQMRT